MRLIKATVLMTDGIYKFDAIENDGEIWLVPQWLDDTPSRGFSTPVRVVRGTLLPRSGTPDHPFFRGPIPKDVFDGTATIGYEVRVLPNLFVETDLLRSPGEPPTRLEGKDRH